MPDESVYQILNYMDLTELISLIDSLTIDIGALIPVLSPEAAGKLLNSIDVEAASAIILSLSPENYAIIEEMAKEDPGLAALRLEAAVKKIIDEADEATQAELLLKLTEMLENVTVETLVDLFIEIANLPETPSTVAYLLDNMNRTTVSLILSAWAQMEEYPTLANVLEYSSDLILDLAYRNMTNTQRTSIFPHLVLDTIIKLPKIGLFEVTNFLLDPPEVSPGMEVQVNFQVSNIGEISDVYQIPIIIDGATEQTYFNMLSPGQSDNIVFVVQRPTDGQYSVKVGDETQTFIVSSPIFNPAAFIIETIEILPSSIRVGDPISVFVTISNIGGLIGTDEFELKIDSETVDTKTSTISPLDRITLIYDLELDLQDGTYTVSVNDFSSDLVINKVPREIPWFTILAILIVIVGLTVYTLRERGIISF
jgi:hypothetical protein